jgi:hypothetical protein
MPLHPDQAQKNSFNRWVKLEDRYDWNAIQENHNQGMSLVNLSKLFKISRNSFPKAIELGLFIKRNHPRNKLSDQVKEQISIKRKQWLKDNPDKHPWRNKDKFKSKPCEKVKEFLSSKDIQFIEEFIPEIEGRSFSIDIAMPDKMIALEINGNQHYEKDGSLKPYYQERHDLLESNDWDVYEIHYSACFKLDKLEEFFYKLDSSEKKVEFDYFTYTPRTKTTYHCCDCGIRVIKRNTIRCKDCRKLNIKNISQNKTKIDRIPKIKIDRIPKINETRCSCGNVMSYRANQCMQCNLIKSRKAIRPSKEELEKLILDYPLTKLGEMFGVSDNAVRKWCRLVGITEFPNNKYRQNVFHSKK